jgi:hypothetical protein
VPAGTHPAAEAGRYSPTEAAWPETREDAQRPELATDQLSASGGEARRRRRLWRRITIAASVIAAAGLAAGLLLGPGRPAAAPVATVPISVKSAQAPVSGDVYVFYKQDQFANAEVSGETSTAANGEVAALYAQQFPFASAPARVGSVVLHAVAGRARYEFQVTPTLETRYRVELFRSGTTSTPFTMSGIATIYVVLETLVSKTPACTVSVCDESESVTYTAPPSALETEMSKTPYVYFASNVSPKAQPPEPHWVSLGAGHGRVAGTQRISADQFVRTVTFTYTVGGQHDHYAWDSLVCTKDSVAADGIGLPGHHGCGDQRLRYSLPYFG